jgi:DNA-binding NtrC family response regulator
VHADLRPELVRIATRIASGDVHEDVFRWLDLIHLHTPPLRDRKQDVPTLVRHSLTRARRAGIYTVTDAAMAALVAYSWPGDVRELQEVVGRMVAGARSPVIDIEDVPRDIRDRHTADALYEAMVVHHESFWTAVYPRLINRQITCAQVRSLVSRGLVTVGGRYTEVARLFNVSVPTDYKRFLNFLGHFDCKPSFKDFRRGTN